MTTSNRLDFMLYAAGLAGIVAFTTLYDRAFPQAAVKVEITRDSVLIRARATAERHGAPVDTMMEAMRFNGRTVDLLFLQRNLGLDEASRWAREEVPIWVWSARWFRPEQKEEWRVGLGLDGKVVGATHLIDDAAPGDSLTIQKAQPIAEAFVRGQGWDLATLDLVESSSQKRERRMDHRFTWEKKGSTINWKKDDPKGGTGAVRVTVDVKGGVAGAYSHFLKVPEDFERDLSRTLSIGSFIALGSILLMFLFTVAALAISVARNASGGLQWKPAFALAAVTAAVLLMSGVASWPSAKYTYETTIAWPAFIGLSIFALLFLMVTFGAAVVFTTTAGESLGREMFPSSMTGFLDVLRGRLFSPDVARASLRGYGMAFAFLGYLTVFYLFARRYLGAWMPAEGPGTEIFNDWAPFLTPLTVGLVAAVTEEITFRLFGISLFKRYLKSTALAVLIPAVIWAFAHSNYPVFPVYVRGIELTIGGVFLGMAFLRFGIVTCLVAHFVINAVQAGMPLVTSGNAYYVISGGIVMGIALVPAVVGLVRGRTPAPVPG